MKEFILLFSGFLFKNLVQSLQPGDIVRIVAPAWKDPYGGESNIPFIKSYIESLGLVPIISENIYSDEDPLYSNSDEFRANDLLSALLDEDCKAIWCITGGSGTARLIPFLEAALPISPLPSYKVLIGFSDITVLHLYLQAKYGWPTVQGTMLEVIGNGTNVDEGSLLLLENLLFNRTQTICEPAMKRLDRRRNFTEIEGTVVTGGTMTIVESSLRTSWEMNGNGKIVFLEDISERAYSIERSLDHLKQAGMFEGAEAIVLGDFLETDNETLLDFVFQRFADDEFGQLPPSCPVFKLTGIGHGKQNWPLPFNTVASVSEVSPGVFAMCVENVYQEKRFLF